MVQEIKHSGKDDFRHSLKAEFSQYLSEEQEKCEPENCLRMDFHCHDKNSDVPDELWGRILRVPETWLKTKKLVKILKQNGCDVITITNHNNASSCWDMIERGYDILPAAEFTCYFPEYELYIHVLTYGFNREQEAVLNEKRSNIYTFLKYAARHDIPVVMPHPLYFYTRNEKIDLVLFEKLAVIFQRFEVLNGQRDLWQSVLTLNWARSLTARKIKRYARKHNLNPAEFGVDPDKPKVLTGGSDDHTGIFAGQCGSILYIPNLQERLKTEKRSDLALEAIRNGTLVPFGHVRENEKLNIAILDYFAQVATHIKDPGLLRIILHRGETRDKVMCFVIANLLMEMQKHKTTQKFFRFIHDALHGKKPNKLIKWKTPKEFKFCVEILERIADSKHESPDVFIDTVENAFTELFTELNKLIIKRIKITGKHREYPKLSSLSTEEITRKFEIPSQMSALFLGEGRHSSDMSNINIKKVLDNLTFPTLITLVMTGVALTSTRVLYANRHFLNEFADSLNKNHHSKRALYLTDTLRDRNGVSNSLTGKLKEIQRTNAPVDFLICHEDADPEAHLYVIRPLASFKVPGYGDQDIRIPDLMEIARIFYQGGYDRVVCSTEGPMALVSLFLKLMFNVPAYFLMHTDWMDFIEHNTDMTIHERDRIRRVLRALYRQFEGVFTLNRDHRDWLIGHEMELQKERVHLTAHHAKARDDDAMPLSKSSLFPDATDDTPVLFLACRLSAEKGVFELPEMLDKVRCSLPDIKIVIAGQGPAEDELKKRLPDAVFLGWLSQRQLAECYLGLDLFVFPSKFDTYGNVILEAFVHGMPVIAYNCKGPKDIIEHGKSGFLVDSIDEMSSQIIHYFSSRENMPAMSQSALDRADEYKAEPIMQRFLGDLGLVEA